MFSRFKNSPSRPETSEGHVLQPGEKGARGRLSSWKMGRNRAFPGEKDARGRLLVAGMALIAALALAGCTSGAYPVDIFYEQHYQQSYKSHEPPRMLGVEDAVAYYPSPPNTTDNSGAHLYEINCQMCHGTDGRESGPVLQKLVKSPADGGYGYQYAILDPETLEPRPPDLTALDADDIEGYLSFAGRVPSAGSRQGPSRPFGPGSVMPPFGRLLSDSERQAIIQYIGTLP